MPQKDEAWANHRCCMGEVTEKALQFLSTTDPLTQPLCDQSLKANQFVFRDAELHELGVYEDP